MVRRSVVTGGIVLALIASVALAQPPKGPGGPGGPRFGGPGMGGPGGMQMSRVMLLGIPEVQKELKLDEQQQDQVKELMDESRKQMQAAFAGMDFQKMQDMSREERTKFFADVRKKSEAATKELDAKVAKILDGGQRDRLEQLQLQREGVAAFNRPEIAKKLGLSEEQQAKIKKIQDEARKPPEGGFPGRDATDEERREFFAQMRKRGEKVQADILAVLTEEQQQKWTEMKGKEFKFPQPQFGPGGPGFGPGGKAGERRRPPAKEQ